MGNEVVVKKFGGTSVATPSRIKHVANIIAKNLHKEKTIIVVSAMAGVTDELVKYTREVTTISKREELAEYDTVIASGEQITAGLLALAFMGLGIKSKSYLGWQLSIKTDDGHSKARIIEIDTKKIIEDINNDIVPIIAGFQGFYNDRITTLGRGGSDTTAVAVAAAMKCNRCDIYTDVDGIFTANPKIVPKARKIDIISHQEAIEMAGAGTKVIHPRAVEIAMQHNISINILNTFSDNDGTIITNKMEKSHIVGISNKDNLMSIKITQTNDAENLTNKFLDLGIELELVLRDNITFSNENEMLCDYTAIFSMEYEDIVEKFVESSSAIINKNLVKISAIGVGLKNDHKVIKNIIDTIKDAGGFPYSFITLETQISFIVAQAWANQIIRNLHTAFRLDSD